MDDTAIVSALSLGQVGTLLEALEGISGPERIALRASVRRMATAMLDGAIGSTSGEGAWRGALRVAHHTAATLALLGTATVRQAVKLHPIELPMARDLIPRLFPHDLEQFVAAWSDRFLADPKGWDRIRGIESMFDWAQRGLIEPPEHHGAVLLLLAQPKIGRYLADRPVLVSTTLPLLFAVPGIKGASAAQRDETVPGESLGERVIPRLVRSGAWSKADALGWCDLALQMPRSQYELRWFRRVKERLAALP